MASKEELKKFVTDSTKHAKDQANALMYGSKFLKVNPNDRKKFSHAQLFESLDMLRSMGQTHALQTVYLHMKEIMQDECSDEVKIKLIFGEVELLLQETTTYFFKNYDPKKQTIPHSSINIDDMRRRYSTNEVAQ